MELVINQNFYELKSHEMLLISGGGDLWEAFVGTAGAVCIAVAPVVGALAGIGASVVATPVVGVAAGVGAAAGMVAAGANMMDWATSR
jgi:hypothetical protein